MVSKDQEVLLPSTVRTGGIYFQDFWRIGSKTLKMRECEDVFVGCHMWGLCTQRSRDTAAAERDDMMAGYQSVLKE